MDNSSSIRQKALERIAAFSATSPASEHNSDLQKLCRGGLNHRRQAQNGLAKGGLKSLTAAPMNIKEFEVLLALCKAAPLLESHESAERLAEQLSLYLLDAHMQTFLPSPFLRDIEPSPAEALSYGLTTALLALGLNHEIHVADVLWGYLNNCAAATSRMAIHGNGSDDGSSELDEALHVVTLTISILGFLDAAATYANYWTAAERLELIERVKRILSESFLISVETAFSVLRNSNSSHDSVKECKRYVRHYAAIGRPLGAMLLQRSLMWLLVAASSLLVADIESLKGNDILDLLMSGNSFARGEVDFTTVETMADIACDEMSLLADGADYLRLGSAWQQRLAFSVKAAALTSYLNCAMLKEDASDLDSLMLWLEEALSDPIQMADETLASVVLRCLALVAKLSPNLAPNISQMLPRFIVQGGPLGHTITVASTTLAFVLHTLSQDAVITTLYTLGNVLSSNTTTEKALAGGITSEASLDSHPNSTFYGGRQSTGSSISLAISGEEETSVVYGNVVQAICGIATSCDDPKITALAQSMLLQKIDKVSRSIDGRIISEAARLSLTGGPLEFRSLLKLYARLCHEGVLKGNEALLNAILKGRVYLSANLSKESPLYEIYLEYLLESIISKGDIHQANGARESDVDLAAREIAQLLQPVAILMSKNDMAKDETLSEEILSLIRDAWFNIAVHGFATSTDRGKRYIDELRIMAIHSRPLVTEQRGEQNESDIELNTVLRRGNSNDHEAAQKKRLTALIPDKVSEVKGLGYRKVIFLQAAYLVETLRANAGDCTMALKYFLEPAMRTGEMARAMESINVAVIEAYLRKTLTGTNPKFSAPYVAKQLASIFSGCCYRIERVQQAALASADRIIQKVPSALCQKASLFALLELLSLMWTSCLESETDEYEWKSSFTSARGKVTIDLSDDYDLRRRTLDNLYTRAKVWVTAVIGTSPLDVKGLLQTYLSEYDDDGAYGHISLGRSFASQMGSIIPSTDQRLGAINSHGKLNINTASDFVAQYTTRQEYRYAEALPDQDAEWLQFMNLNERRGSAVDKTGKQTDDAATVLAHLEARANERKYIPFGESRDILRRAAALLCRTKKDECAIVHHLVNIPFSIFTKQSINRGISLWLGVINENPQMEPRILTEIVQQWENTIHKRLGIFNARYMHPDPFFLKEEFAPSDREALSKQQQAARNILTPHMRLLFFLSSHYNATRLGSPNTEHIFLRLLAATLNGLKNSTGHPLAREVRFHVVLFGLKVLRYSTALTASSRNIVKGQILSAALSWFSFAPRWSFGGNRIQLLAEVRLLGDVSAALKDVPALGQNPTPFLRELLKKENLLVALIESEQTRLSVWLFPMSEPPRDIHLVNHGSKLAEVVAPLVHTAWVESPSLAIQLVSRFSSERIRQEVRSLLLSSPEKALSVPEAVQVLLGGSLPTDASSQLKHLLYWAPVNPITAITYFLPEYCNDPFVIQYAMRALESHSVDVTFFYVPQIVQTLRFDALGYVARYVVETAQFSQLFAHQIIWNMKANAYKDEDSQIPDDIKPTLDVVMDRIVTKFSAVDKAFFEKEFRFFDKVTNISGLLKPFIKSPKAVKKQKIEEELRKIVVEVGVYLPSNPDGVVIGIDRKSGKPLQSHAKAPYMATFRIKKSKGDLEGTDNMLEEANKNNNAMPQENTIEIWQSAIFKVGDDCRQDVLALQMIAAFRGIFNDVGLDVYVFPNRVTATAPGCGVIDVLPNSISRDMVGREAVNGLYDYFVSKYGNEDSLRFQEARNNFVKSMAAYSMISFLLQFKDRHNGNIMIDDAGHILHIDFGFCFDIAPGGVKFERAPFKLTSEMVAVMGGRTDHQAFKWFEELCVKAFLASRQHTEKLSQIVLLMMQSGLPCFKPETIQHFKERFVLEKSDREAADFMRFLVKKSYSSYSTGVYDQFQQLTNGIPY